MCYNLSVLLQDIIRDYEIKLDWFFKASMIHDLVNVSVAICYCH